jgi:aldehyde:ferredoxin oxidoreductase
LILEQKRLEGIKMPYGYNGKILHVNLSNAETWVDQHNPAWYRMYLGGRNVALYYLLNELSGPQGTG